MPSCLLIISDKSGNTNVIRYVHDKRNSDTVGIDHCHSKIPVHKYSGLCRTLPARLLLFRLNILNCLSQYMSDKVKADTEGSQQERNNYQKML